MILHMCKTDIALKGLNGVDMNCDTYCMFMPPSGFKTRDGVSQGGL